MDTVFIVLAKKERQFSFLHCFHHSTVGIAVWYGMWWSPSGDSYLPTLLNSLVHLCMYSYYLMSTLGLKVRLLLHSPAWRSAAAGT